MRRYFNNVHLHLRKANKREKINLRCFVRICEDCRHIKYIMTRSAGQLFGEKRSLCGTHGGKQQSQHSKQIPVDCTQLSLALFSTFIVLGKAY